MSKSKVEDLKERFIRGELTPKQAKKILQERGLREVESWKWWVYGLIIFAAYFILWLLPTLSQGPLKHFNLESLECFTQLTVYHFPMVVIYLSGVILAIDIAFAIWMHMSHVKWGGFKESGETLIFYRKGPFVFMRHPGVFGMVVGFAFLPIVMSFVIKFTPLTVAAIIIFLAYNYHYVLCEEKMNLKKWGDEYRRYMKEVPRFNFILGLWRFRKQK